MSSGVEEQVPWVADRSVCGCCGGPMRRDALVSPDRFFGRSTEYRFDECTTCRTVVLWCPGWSAAEAYPADYPAHAADPTVKWYHRALPRYFFPAVPAAAPDPVVEIGAGTGQFLAYLAARGRAVRGYEMDLHAVERARAAGLPVDQGTWESFTPPPASVGVLVMNQVIEHLVEPPGAVFEKARRVLKPGGVWVIRTPNAGAWGRRHFGSFWHPLEVPRHTVIYSLSGIQTLARRTGFQVASARCCGRWYDLGQSALYRKQDVLSGFRDKLLDMRSLGSPVSRLWAMNMNMLGRGDSMELVLAKP